MKHDELSKADVEKGGEPAVYINTDGDVCGAERGAAQLFGFEAESFIGLSVSSLLTKDSIEAGRNLQKALDGKIDEQSSMIQTRNGRRVIVTMDVEVLVVDGEKVLEVTPTSIEEPESTQSESVVKNPTDSSMDDINDEKLEQISQNVRVDSPVGDMPLAAIMQDIMVGHNEVEQYKKGALTMHKAVDERLEEEEKRNPNSDEVTVLNDVKDSAFGLYQRIQQGDENTDKSVNV